MGILDGIFGGRKTTTISAIDANSLEGTGRRRKIEIVGERYHDVELTKVAGPKTADSKNIHTTATLIPDPRNRHDKNAVEVRIEGRLVGYLSREQAVGYHSLMNQLGYGGQALANVEARIYGGRREGSYESDYGVAIYLPESLAKQIGFLDSQ